MKIRILPESLLVLFLFTVTASVTFGQAEKTPASIDDFFDIQYAGSPVVSPDGDWVAYTVRSSDYEENNTETRIWMIPAKGGEPLPMTAKGYSAGNPQWSPDGKYLSFTASRNGSNGTQVWVLNRMGGEAQQLTFVEQGVSGYEWSPEGSRLLLMIRDKDEDESDEPRPYVIDRLQFKRDYAGYLDRRRTHIYTFTPGDTTVTQLTFGDFDHSGATWSPDGQSIAFVSNRTDNPDGNTNNDIWIVSADEGEKEGGLIQVTTNRGSDSSPAWSPDGTEIAYTTNVEPEKIWYATSHLATISADGNGTARLLTKELDRNISSPRYSEDGESIYFIFEDAGETQLASIQNDGSGFTRLVQGEVTVSDYSMHGDYIAMLKGTFSSPNEVYYYLNGESTQLTQINREYLDRVEIAEFEEIRFNSRDGTEIHGFLVKPVGYEPGNRYPTLLRIHGGPVAQYSHSYSFEAQLFAANGYVVIMTNPRGSSGYGQAFSEILFADWGNKDFEDVIAGVDYAIEQGYSDPERLGVGGWSYGGILTNYVITKSDRFKGAISGASETLYRSNYGHDHYQLYWEKELGLPWETPEKWERISPFNDVANVTTPTLWIGGSDDWNVPILGSEQMYQAMKRLGLETQLVVYPGEHHGIRRLSFQKDRFERYLEWYAKYVLGE
jgi:dipeptidyl aminopeptidase/acylaminoacyl peptidase